VKKRYVHCKQNIKDTTHCCLVSTLHTAW